MRAWFRRCMGSAWCPCQLIAPGQPYRIEISAVVIARQSFGGTRIFIFGSGQEEKELIVQSAGRKKDGQDERFVCSQHSGKRQGCIRACAARSSKNYLEPYLARREKMTQLLFLGIQIFFRVGGCEQLHTGHARRPRCRPVRGQRPCRDCSTATGPDGPREPSEFHRVTQTRADQP